MSGISDTLLQRLVSEHACAPGATDAELAAAETRLGVVLPPQLRAVLRAANGADLWSEGDCPCRLLSTTELEPPSKFVWHPGPSGHVAIVVQKGSASCLAVGTDSKRADFGKVIDCFHETYPHELPGVADSISGLLKLVLDCGGNEWIWPAAVAYNLDYAVR